jgi:hypothetical protein
MGSKSWLSEVEGLTFKTNVWKNVAIITSFSCALLGVSTLALTYKVLKDFKSERLVLVPALQRKMIIPAEGFVSDSFVAGAARRIVELQEQWTYETIEDHYTELFQSYYSHGLAELTRANLIASNRFKYARKNKLISTFRFDHKASEYTWCKKIKRSCALVVGTRRIYINHNEPYSEKKVAYFMLAESVWPTEDHPFALKFSRVKIDDTSVDPRANLIKQFNAAKMGVNFE